MTIEPGYYWIRWPNDPAEEFRDWNVGLFDVSPVTETIVLYLAGLGEPFSMTGAELGPRIEPPETK
jgi:hypothetical protein